MTWVTRIGTAGWRCESSGVVSAGCVVNLCVEAEFFLLTIRYFVPFLAFCGVISVQSTSKTTGGLAYPGRKCGFSPEFSGFPHNMTSKEWFFNDFSIHEHVVFREVSTWCVNKSAGLVLA